MVDDCEYEDEEDAIHTRLKLHIKDPRYVYKSDYDSRGRGRRKLSVRVRNRYRNLAADRFNMRTRGDIDRSRPGIQTRRMIRNPHLTYQQKITIHALHVVAISTRLWIESQGQFQSYPKPTYVKVP